MIDYREIIRLKSLKFSNVAIANSLCCSRNTVSEVLKLAGSHSLEWPVPDTLTNNDIEHLFYPDRGTNEGRRLPDYEYVYNELAKPGVNKFYLITTLLDISVDQFFFPCNEDGDNNRRKQVDVLLNDMEEKELIVMEATAQGLKKARETAE